MQIFMWFSIKFFVWFLSYDKHFTQIDFLVKHSFGQDLKNRIKNVMKNLSMYKDHNIKIYLKF